MDRSSTRCMEQEVRKIKKGSICPPFGSLSLIFDIQLLLQIIKEKKQSKNDYSVSVFLLFHINMYLDTSLYERHNNVNRQTINAMFI